MSRATGPAEGWARRPDKVRSEEAETPPLTVVFPGERSTLSQPVPFTATVQDLDGIMAVAVTSAAGGNGPSVSAMTPDAIDAQTETSDVDDSDRGHGTEIDCAHLFFQLEWSRIALRRTFEEWAGPVRL